jgi:hypothetical protein
VTSNATHQLPWVAAKPGVPPPWGLGLFPVLGLPGEQRGPSTLWAGDPPEKKGGVSAQIVWTGQRGVFAVTLYAGFGATSWQWAHAPDLFTAYMMCVDHFNKHPITQGGHT